MCVCVCGGGGGAGGERGMSVRVRCVCMCVRMNGQTNKTFLTIDNSDFTQYIHMLAVILATIQNLKAVTYLNVGKGQVWFCSSYLRWSVHPLIELTLCL